jgi:hypothetical protein
MEGLQESLMLAAGTRSDLEIQSGYATLISRGRKELQHVAFAVERSSVNRTAV